MAGAGINLKKILGKNTYLADILGYVYGALISSGPWVLTVLCVFILDLAARYLLTQSARNLLLGTVTSCFIYSLIVSGPFQMGVSRYVSDCLYQKNYDRILPSFLASCLLLIIVLGTSGTLLWGFTSYSLLYRIFSVHLFITLGLLWLVIIYLTMSKDYWSIMLGYGVGTFLSIFLGVEGAIYFGMIGLLGGFTIGQMVTLVWLVERLISQLPYSPQMTWDILSVFKKSRTLVLIGLLYNLAIWVDQVIFWWGAPDSVAVSYFLYFHPAYDSAKFLTFLSVIPTIALFVIREEVTFFRTYRSYYQTILKNRPLSEIKEAHRELVDKVKLTIERLIKMQGTICLLIVFLAPQIVNALQTQVLKIALVRYLAIGASFHILFYLTIIFLLYFDFQEWSLWLLCGFATINLTGTLITLQLGTRFYGIGYLVAGFVMFLIALRVLLYELNRLEYVTFVEHSGALEMT